MSKRTYCIDGDGKRVRSRLPWPGALGYLLVGAMALCVALTVACGAPAPEIFGSVDGVSPPALKSGFVYWRGGLWAVELYGFDDSCRVMSDWQREKNAAIRDNPHGPAAAVNAGLLLDRDFVPEAYWYAYIQFLREERPQPPDPGSYEVIDVRGSVWSGVCSVHSFYRVDPEYPQEVVAERDCYGALSGSVALSAASADKAKGTAIVKVGDLSIGEEQGEIGLTFEVERCEDYEVAHDVYMDLLGQ